MDDLESLLNPEEIEAFLRGKPVSDKFIAELEEHTKSLVQKMEVITKDLPRPGDGSFSQTEVTLDKD